MPEPEAKSGRVYVSSLDQLVLQATSVRERFNLDGSVAIVCGGSRGLGQAMAVGLAAAGADVCVVGRNPVGLEQTAEAIAKLGRRGSKVVADLTDETQVEQLVRTVLEVHGQVDVLVNSQGTVALAPTDEFDVNSWQSVIDVNLKSVFLCCKHVGGEMLKRGRGKIINVSSVRGFQGRAQDPAYAPSKGAVNQLTRSLAIEWGARGINVNAIAPVFTRTEMSAPFLDDAKLRDWVLSRIPMRRVGELEDLFGPVIFLASGASDFVNGHVLLVDGGWVAA